MPRLVHRPLKGSVEADFDDFVIVAEHSPAHCRGPRVRAEVGEAAEGLRMDLHIPAARPTPDSPSWALDCLPEPRQHILAHALGPVAGESALQPNDPVAGKGLSVGANINSRRLRYSVHHHGHRFLTQALRSSNRRTGAHKYGSIGSQPSASLWRILQSDILIPPSGLPLSRRSKALPSSFA
jgi:hypothetical protein